MTSLKVSLSVGDLNPHQMYGFLGPMSPHPKWHLDLFSCFSIAQLAFSDLTLLVGQQEGHPSL